MLARHYSIFACEYSGAGVKTPECLLAEVLLYASCQVRAHRFGLLGLCETLCTGYWPKWEHVYTCSARNAKRRSQTVAPGQATSCPLPTTIPIPPIRSHASNNNTCDTRYSNWTFSRGSDGLEKRYNRYPGVIFPEVLNASPATACGTMASKDIDTCRRLSAI